MDLLRTLGLQIPVIQAPMAGHQAGAMALAVGEAGALGSLPCATLSADGIGRELQMLAEATERPVNVNFFVHDVPPEDPAREMSWRATLAPWYAEFGIDPGTIRSAPGRSPFDAAAAEVLARFRPRVVSFHFGLPAPELLALVKSWGSLVMASATTVDEAVWLEARGADVIIAQGVEAGGHRGMFLSGDITTQMSTLALLPQVVRAVRVPVVAAGGIADAAGVRAALALGASAAQVGTAFLLCPEATISEVHRRALASPAARHTALTNLFTGRPARGIFNRAMRELGPMREDVPRFPLATTAMAPLRSAAEASGSGDFSPMWSGQNASGCRSVPAGELARSLGGLD